MTQLFNFELEIWYRQNDEKEFMERTILAETPEKALELANSLRKNIFKINIKKTEPYNERKV